MSLANIRYLFSSLNVRMIDATVNLFTFGWTRWPASLMVIPCTRTWSTSVARISSETNVLWPLPLPLPLCLPPLSAFSPLGSTFQSKWSPVALFILPEILMCVSSILLLSSRFKVQGFFICHMINYTGYNQKWNVGQIRSAQWTVQRKK